MVINTMQHSMPACTRHRHSLASTRTQTRYLHLHSSGAPPQRVACPALPPQRQLPETTSASSSQLPSSATGSSSSASSSGRQPEPPRRPRWLAWLPPFVNLQKLMQFVQSVGFGVVAMAVLMTVRFTLLTQARSAPREVLYSDLMALVDTGRVRSARLESATSRLYFDVTPAAATADAAATEEAARAAASPAAAAAASTSTAAASTSSPTATAATAAGTAATAAAPQTITPAAHKAQRQRPYYVKLADKQDPFLVGHILRAGVEFGVVKASFSAGLANTVLSALGVWLPLLPFFYVMKKMLDQRNGMGTKRKRSSVDTSKVTFADVAGVETAKEELMEVVACLRNAAQYSKVRARMPGGVLLCGPPGTGKTLLAKAVAGEAGVPFMACSASEFVELFVGRGAARVRELFAEARKHSPCVVFIDELDALGGKRGMGYNDERDQTLNQLLTELDGFEGRPGVLLLAATNRAEVLDPALLRPGRISRRVVVPLPSEEGRRAILKVHLRDTPMASELDKLEAIERLGTVTKGFSGAELANIVNEASLLAARQGHELVTLRELLEGVQRTKFGVNGTGPRFGTGVLSRLMDAAAGKQGRPVKVSPA